MIKKRNKQELNHLDRDKIRVVLKNNMDGIVKKIRNLMYEKGATQQELADAICSDQRHISRVLNKGNGITINVLSRIAFALNTPIHELTKI